MPKTKTAPRLTPPLKWHGGKWYLTRQILALAPPHIHYVEPFAGGLQVLLAKDPEGVSEVVNDIHGGLMHFWRVLQDPDRVGELHRTLEAMPFSEAEYQRAVDRLDWPSGDPIERAVAFFVACRQSLAGRMDAFTGITKTRTRRGMNNETSAWLSAVDGLPAVHARLRRVVILDRDALDVIRQQDGPQTWFYLDPPYPEETRTAPKVYAHETGGSLHAELIDVLAGIKGKFALSSYPNALYEAAAERHDWNRHEFNVPNNAAGGKKKRRMKEYVWTNYEPDLNRPAHRRRRAPARSATSA